MPSTPYSKAKKNVLYIYCKKKKRVFPVDFLRLGPKTPPQTMPIPVTSKENKITKTVPNPGFHETPNSEQNKVPKRELASYDLWVNSKQGTVLYCLQVKNDFYIFKMIAFKMVM